MTSREFARFFRPFVRVLLDWEAVEEADWPVDVDAVDTVAELADWYFPWHVGPDGDEARFDDPGARPLRVLDWAPASFSAHRDAVDSAAAVLRDLPLPTQLVIGAYALPNGGRLVLDGNHRLAAIVQEGMAFRGLVVTLNGPLDERILPDLRHWIV